MDRSTRRRRLWLALAVLAFVGAVLAVRTPPAWNQACALARRNLPVLLGMDVGIGRCEIDPVAQSVRLYGLSAFPPGGEEPLFFAESAEVRLRSFEPFFRTVRLELIQLTRPRLNLDLGRRPAAVERETPRCPLDILEHLWVDRLQIKDAALQLRFPGGQRVELSGLDLEWAMRRGVADLELDAREGLLHLGPGRGELSLNGLSIEGALDPGAGTLELTHGELGLDDVMLSVSGRIEQLCEPTLSLDGQLFLPARTAARAAGLKTQVSGHLWAGISASGRLDSPVLTVDLVTAGLALGRYRPGDLTGRLAWSGEELRLLELSVPLGGGTLRASGSLAARPSLPLKLKVDAEGAQLGRVLERVGLPGAWVDLFATGSVSLQGNLLPVSLSGEADLRTAGVVVASRPFDAPPTEGRTVLAFEQGRVAGPVRVLPDHVELSGLTVSSGRTHLSLDAAALYYDATRGLAIRGRGDVVDLSDFGEVAGLRTSGNGFMSFEVRGPYRDVAVEAGVSLRDFDFWDFSLGVVQGKVLYHGKLLRVPALTGQKGKTQYFGSVELDFHEGGSAMELDISLPRGRTEDVLDAISGLHWGVGLFQGDLQGDAEGHVRINRTAGRMAGVVDLDLSRTTYYGRNLGDGKLLLSFTRAPGGERFMNGEAMELRRFTLSGPLGELSLEGRYSFDGPLDYHFRGERLSLAELFGSERARRLGISGTLALVGEVGGDSTVPQVTGYLTSPGVTFAGRNLGEMHLEGRIQGRELHVWGRPFNDAQGLLKMRLKDPEPYEATVTFALPEIRPLLPDGAISQGLSGMLSGTLNVQGTVKGEDSTRLSARLDRLRLSRGDFTGENEEPIVLSHEQGRTRVEPFTFHGPNTELMVGGWAGPQNLDVKLRGELDVRLLESFVPQLERTSGKIELAAAASGSLSSPGLLGSAVMRDVRLSLKDGSVSVRGLSGGAEFSESRVLVQDVHGVLNDGRVSLYGDVRLDRFAIKGLEVKVQLDEVGYLVADDLPLTASGELALYGKPEALVLAGSVDVVKLRYEKPLVLESLLAELGRARGGGSGGGAEKGREAPLRLDVGIHLGDVRVDNNLAKARLLGDLRLTGTSAQPGLLGTIEADEGSQAFFRGNRFAVGQGLVEFRSRNGIDGVFDMHAQTQIREYLVRLHTFGKLNSPQFLLSAEPGLSEGDIISLLTLGVTSRDKSNTAVSGAGLAAEALLSASGLDKQVQRFLPKNPFLRDLSFHISTTFNDATGLVEPAAQLESKFLFEQLKLGMTRPVSGKGTRALLEYRFDNGLSTQALWENEQSDRGFGNLGLDLKLRWEVE